MPERSARNELRPRRIQRYGWVPDIPDARDLMFAAPEPVIRTLPRAMDLRPQMPAVYDQGQLGSCTANAIGGAFEFVQLKEGLPDLIPSRLFIYYNERLLEGTVDQDSGAMIRDGMKIIHKLGACSENTWTYEIEKFTAKPPDQAYTEALDHQVLVYRRVQQVLRQMQGCLAAGYPFVFGFTVYDSFESEEVAKTGVVPLPAPTESVLGGHAVLAVGYDDETQRFIVRNSWGPGWGMAGYFTMPYGYLTDASLAQDFWTIRIVETPAS
ncbi:Cysteine protease, C1A family [Nakamurella panacisegetis]|uniref:Cysteine protease, C1A family n=1 Tax=Nakamurella panacisegetis TaxID=1090615 RepID=A0A1H0SYK0_9ACTN|nr:C1 family peptidase [Nakamurella panacisegetis]SDP46897.1 Cysteine protease, C1A family [Nakamurella panacisegetis]